MMISDVKDYLRPEKLKGPKDCRSSVILKGGRFIEIDIPATSFSKCAPSLDLCRLYALCGQIFQQRTHGAVYVSVSYW